MGCYMYLPPWAEMQASPHGNIKHACHMYVMYSAPSKDMDVPISLYGKGLHVSPPWLELQATPPMDRWPELQATSQWKG